MTSGPVTAGIQTALLTMEIKVSRGSHREVSFSMRYTEISKSWMTQRPRVKSLTKKVNEMIPDDIVVYS